ncbi:hypothetical protein QSJ18_13865 [Gordonia sp. ABSL1-1]|uniref:hypothetical protein n=1 Tax=Gordonia sp. ABSL1-1 TaxID=3053923 RepID=UPI0025734CCF|nr:hypothetical protein [Gordonia sp. ABSL1-1]MDL9937836.1 hypothetical protein [Gordonia sp. ABSL1-1]
MKRTATLATSLLTATAIAGAVIAGPAAADPLSDLFGSAGSSGGSSGFGSSDNKPKHYGKLGRPDARNGVKSINVWVYAPNKTPEISPGVYPRGSKLGVRWNSTIDAGPVVSGKECQMSVHLTGPKVPAKAAVTKTQECTSKKSYLFRSAGTYKISVTDAISGASNSITFTLQ